MKISEYFSSKAITLCIVGIAALVWGLLLYFCGVSGWLVLLSETILILTAIIWLFCGFFCENAKLKKLARIKDGLADKYLLGELLPPPTNATENQYYNIMKTVSHSAIGKAEQAEREKEDYCNYVESWIHEIKTPLTACTLILSNGGEASKLKRELKRADNLTETILTYARLRSIEKDTQITKVHVSEVIDDALKSQMELLIAANIGVDTNGDFSVFTDSKSLCFILKQLFINCAKYCRGCRVSVTAANGAITVLDNGRGIPAHEISRVTERGFTGANGRSMGGATGMGLYLVRELCEKLSITLKIESKEDKYTQIVLSFDSLTKV